MVLWGTTGWRQENGRPLVIVGSRPAVYLMAVVIGTIATIPLGLIGTISYRCAMHTGPG